MAVNRELQARIKQNREAWAKLNLILRALERNAKIAHAYSSKINNKGGYISIQNGLTLGSKMENVQEAINELKYAFSNAMAVIGVTSHINTLMDATFK